MRQALMKEATELRAIRDRLLALRERSDAADHFLDHRYAISAIRAQAADAGRLADSLQQLAAYRAPPPPGMAEPRPPVLPASLREDAA